MIEYLTCGNSMIYKTKLLIIGAIGHGRVVADIAQKMNKWQKIAFLEYDEKQNLAWK